MAPGVVGRKRSIKGGSKVKTGCATCRIRKVKCDENKPSCQKCVKTGRTCDGYESPFRVISNQPINSPEAGPIKPVIGLRATQPTSIEVTPQEIDLLSRCFSTKTLFDVDLGCNEEAKQVLQASLSDPTLRHAILSLRALREDLETSGDDPASVAQQTPTHQYGLQQYSMALRGLAFNLSSSGSNGLRSAILCCQILISIEQVRKDYSAMAKHIIQGLKIIREYRARPYLMTTNKIVPAHYAQLPFLDVFIIKLFVAPCKFADSPATPDAGQMLSMCLKTVDQRLAESRDFRTIVPDMRIKLTTIATLTLEFLDKVSQVESVEVALQLISEKAALLASLQSWLLDFDVFQKMIRSPGPEPVSASFLRLFHLILKIVLVGTLDSTPDLYTQLRTENGQLQSLANDVGERVRAYVTCGGAASVPNEHCIG